MAAGYSYKGLNHLTPRPYLSTTQLYWPDERYFVLCPRSSLGVRCPTGQPEEEPGMETAKLALSFQIQVLSSMPDVRTVL